MVIRATSKGPERKISTINIEYDVPQIQSGKVNDVSLDSSYSTSRDSNRLEECKEEMELQLKTSFSQKAHSFINNEISQTEKPADTSPKDDFRLKVLEKDRTRGYSTVTFDVSVSIHEMNTRYERNLKESKPIHSRRPTFKRLKPPRLGSFYGNLKRRSQKRKTSTEIRKDLFNKKAEKTITYSKLCIAIAASFLVFTLMGNILSISYAKNQEAFKFVQKDGEVYTAVANFLEALNYSGNFFLYCMTNTAIRRAAKNDMKYLINFFFIPIRILRSFF